MFAPVLVLATVSCLNFHGPAFAAFAGDLEKPILPAFSQVVDTVCPMPYIVSNTLSTPLGEFQK